MHKIRVNSEYKIRLASVKGKATENSEANAVERQRGSS